MAHGDRLRRWRGRARAVILVQLQVVIASSFAATVAALPIVAAPVTAAAYTGASQVTNLSPLDVGLPGNTHFGGRVEDLAIDPANANIVLAASELGGLWKSTNGGSSWAHVDSLPMTAMRSVMYAPGDANLVIATGGADSHVSDQGGIWRSIDGGGTWSHVGDPAGCTPATHLGVDIMPGSPGSISIFVGGLCGLSYSTDSGAHWSFVDPDNPGGCCTVVDDVKARVVGAHTTVYACGSAGFWRSTDGAATWSPTDATSPLDAFAAGSTANGTCSVAVAPNDPNAVFASSYLKNIPAPGCGAQLQEADNADQAVAGASTHPTWNNLSPCGNDRNGRRPWVITQPSLTGDATKFEVYFGNDFRIQHQTCSYSATPHCAAGAPSGGSDAANWPLFDGSLPHNGSDPTDIAFSLGTGCPVLESGDGGIFGVAACNNSPTFTVNTYGLSALDALGIAGSVYTTHTDLYFGTQDNGLYASGDAGATWRDVALWDIYGVLADHDGPSSRVLFRTCCGNGLGQANEDFSTVTNWSAVPPGNSPASNNYWAQFGNGDYAIMTPDVAPPVNPGDPQQKWTLWVTTNNGSSWAQVGPSPLPGPPGCCSNDGYVQAAGPSATPTFFLQLAVGGSNAVYKVSGPLNNTATLTNVTGNLNNLAFFAVNPANPSELYAYDQGSQKMRRSSVGGTTWADDNPLSAAITRGGTFNFSGQATTINFDGNSTAIMVGTNDAGAFASIDDGAHWAYVRGSDQLPRIPGFFFDERTSNIYATSGGRGLWRVDAAPLSTLSIGTPHWPLSSPQFVTSATPFTLSAIGHKTVASVSYRFFLQGGPAPAYTTVGGTSTTFSLSGADGTYEIDTYATDSAGTEETPQVSTIKLDNTPPVSTLTIGSPHYPAVSPHFVTSATPLTLTATDAGSGVRSVAYRVFPQGGVPPAYTTVSGATAGFTITGPDGNYEIDTFSTDNLGNTETVHVLVLYLDNTAPIITINQPQPTTYPHSATLTLDYTVTDGAGSGVQSVTPTMDGATTLAGHGLASGQAIWLLVELPLGPHTFKVAAVDNLGNADAKSVTFTIIVTPQSIKDDVNEFCAKGFITKDGICNSLLAKLDAAAAARARGQCDTSDNIYEAFINELAAQSGKAVDPTAAAIMTADAQYLIDHCP